MNEIQEVKDDIKEIKADQKEVIKAMNDLQVLVAGQYVTKKEFDDHKKENSDTNRWFAGICVTIGLFVLGIVLKIT